MMPRKSFVRRTFLTILMSIGLFSYQSNLVTVKAANSNDTGYVILQIVVGFIAVSVVISLIVYIILSLKRKTG